MRDILHLPVYREIAKGPSHKRASSFEVCKMSCPGEKIDLNVSRNDEEETAQYQCNTEGAHTIYIKISRIIVMISLCVSHTSTNLSNRKSVCVSMTTCTVSLSLDATASETPSYKRSPCLCKTSVYEFLRLCDRYYHIASNSKHRA